MSSRVALVEMRGKVIKMPLHRNIEPLQPAAMYSKEAAKYVKINHANFNTMVRDGKIPARSHCGRVRDIFLKEDLDAYLRSLPIKNAVCGNMPADGRQNPEG